MKTIVGLWRRLWHRPVPQRQAPMFLDIGQRIQAREQAAARGRVRALGRQRRAEHLYDGLTR
ncbi:hypothetical protein LADH09A_004889 [Micromonospora sp. LAH09]|uniref:hypothetical protein n=1 Tax=Micromonospora cabrerizensis TaxID=2911213 RepID=UPI001EE801BD|nr:hypothetical protein [Micromonospora cabrerizensis]MCG5470917.1 hypothetical protein [Micromonospora cabrerizensis]